MRPLFLRLFVGLLLAVALSHAVGISLVARVVGNDRARLVDVLVQERLDDLAADVAGLPLAEQERAFARFREQTGLEVDRADAVRSPRRPGPPPIASTMADGRLLVVRPGGPPGLLPLLPLQVGGVLLVVAAMGWGLAAPLVRDLQGVERAVARLAADEHDARAALPGPGPVRDLAIGVNALADRVQRLLTGQRQLFQAVSHELRTPNARIRFLVEALADEDDADERARLLGQVDGDLAEVDALLDELLAWLRFDVEAAPGPAEPFAPVPALADVADRLSPLHPDVRVQLELGDLPSPRASRRWFVRAIENLLTNALRHARSTVRVAGHVDGAALVVVVEDDGPGIPPERRATVFDPFTTTDESRARSLGGVGLGLAIVERVLRHHGGSVSVDDGPLGGARFTTRWPLG